MKVERKNERKKEVTNKGKTKENERKREVRFVATERKKKNKKGEKR